MQQGISGYLNAESAMEFDEFDSDKGFLVKHGNGRNVPGLDEGLHTMKVGGKRRIIVPPKLGYVSSGLGPIPVGPYGRWKLNRLLDRMVEAKGGNVVFDVEMKSILDGFPKSAHPMGILAALTSALTSFNPKSVDVENEKDMYNAVCKTMGKFLVIATWTFRKNMGYPLNYYDNTKGYVENFMRLMFEIPTEPYKVSQTVIDALDKLFILHADHEQNCSTSTVRMVGSSHAGLFASISAGVSALWGPLHGGANQAVLEMLEEIHNNGGDTDKYLAKAKDKEDPFRLMGFGHRVYKNFDPRAKIIKQAANEVLATLGVEDPILEIARKLETAALEDEYFKARNLYPNVDFYSGIIYRALGIPTDMFTVMFAIGRLPGWIAQWKEMRENKEPIGRPRQIYTGSPLREFKK